MGCDAERGQGLGQRLGLQHHAFAAAEGAVVDGAMAVVGEVAQIVDAHLDQSFGQRAAQNAVLEDAGEEAGKDGDDLKAHTFMIDAEDSCARADSDVV